MGTKRKKARRRQTRSSQDRKSAVRRASAVPTRARFLVLGFLCTLGLILYIDRICIGQAEQSIRDDLGLTKTHMSWVFNAFTLAYCLFEVPMGHWGDRHGSRGVIARIVIWWSAFTALTGAAFSLWSLVAIRFLFGAGEAGAYPNTARVVTRWFPVQERGRARGAITTTALLGAALAPILSAFLIQRLGWRLTFVVFGAIGVGWALAFYAWFRDDPALHPAVNEAERRHIGSPPSGSEAHAGIPWRLVLTSPNVWLLSAIMTVSAILFYMQFQWYPTYLKEARGQGQMASGWLTSLLMTGGALGCLTGGWLADAIQRVTHERRWTRRLTGAGALAMSAGSVLLGRLMDSVVLEAICNAAALFFVQLSMPTWWGVVAEISGRHGAALWGLMNSMAGLGLMVTTPLVGSFIDGRKEAGYPEPASWGLVFLAVAGGLALGALCWLAIDPTRSVVGETSSDKAENSSGKH